MKEETSSDTKYTAAIADLVNRRLSEFGYIYVVSENIKTYTQSMTLNTMIKT